MKGNMFTHIYQMRSSSFGTSYEEEIRRTYSEIENGITKNNVSSAPRIIMFKVTDRCNSGCIYCGYARQNTKNQISAEQDYPNTESLIDVFDQAATIGVDAVALNGGEPLLRRDIVELVSALSVRKILPILMTNGILLRSKWDALGAAGLRYIVISLDSLNPEHYRFQRGVGFDIAFQGIQAAMKLREKYGDTAIHLTTVLTRYNLEDMIPLAEFCTQNKLWLEISVYDTYGMTEDKLSVTDRDRLEKAVCELINMRKNGAYISSSEEYMRHLPEFCINHRRIPEKYTCFSGYGILLMDTLLNVRPCWGSKVGNIGNMNQSSLGDLWKSEQMCHYRKTMLCGECGGCWNLCTEFNTMVLEMRKIFKGDI